jgi:CRP-like cAMP-binding protein
LDIPPHTRNVLIVIALAGMICAVIGSLMGEKGKAIEADKIVHFVGYTMLGTLMIMGLRPMLWPFGLILVAGMSAALELIQPIFGRTTDWSGDFVTNCIAVVVGGSVGLIGRFLWSYVRTEAVNAEIRKATVGFGDGQIIFRQGEPSDKFYIIRSGQVVLTREANGTTSELAKVGPGEVVGEMGVLQGLSRSATATAKGKCWLYGMTLQDLVDKRSDGQDHPGSVVSRVLAQRLRKAMEKGELNEKEFGIALQSAQATAHAVQTSNIGAVGGADPVSGHQAHVKLRMGWRNGEDVNWSPEESTHVLPLAFGRNPGPTGLAGTEIVLVEENPPHWLAPLQFVLEAQGRVVVLKDDQSTHGNEVSGISIGPASGVTQVELPAGQHVLVAGGEGSPFVMVLEIPEVV